MGNYCTRRRDTISYRRYQARINAGRPQAVTGGRNREDIRRNLRENGYVGFEYIFRHSNRAVERGPEHSMIIANAENVPAPVDENSENSRPFAENRFNEDIFRRPIVHEIPDDDVESTGLHRLPPHPMQGLDYNVISYKVPIFLTPFVNLKSGVKLQLKFYASSVGYKTLKVYGEAAFLFTHLRGLTLYYLCNKEDSKMEPNVLLEENHGRLRRRNMKLRKRRHMKVRYRMMKKQSFLIIAGNYRC